MERYDALEGAMAALQDAALDGVSWPTAWALVGEACATFGNALIVAGGSGAADTVHFAQFFLRGQRRPDLEREYFQLYCRRDERVPRVRQLPDGHVVAVRDLYSEEEKKTSAAYNEWVCRFGNQSALNMRLDGPNGSRIVWSLGKRIGSDAWSSGDIEAIKEFAPHVRQFVRVRQALAGADALGASLVELLDHTGIGLIVLDRRGRVVEANGPASRVLRCGDGLVDREGSLGVWAPADNARLQRLIARSLPPTSGRQRAGGSLMVRRPSGLPGLILHVTPCPSLEPHLGASPAAAFVLVVDPASRPRFNARLVGSVLGLSAAESQVAVMFAQGDTASDIAAATGRKTNTVKALMRRVYRKLGISRQAELVRQLMSLPDLSRRR